MTSSLQNKDTDPMAEFFSDSHKDYPDPPRAPAEQALIDLEFEGSVKSVSFSTLSTYEHCPYAVYLNKVKDGGIKPVGSPAMDRGSEIHDMLERYVLGELESVDWLKMRGKNHYSPIIEEFKTLHEGGLCVPELKLAFRKDMTACDWFDDDVWLRGAIDIATFSEDGTHATLYDYKTGSDRSAAKHRAQLQLYALLTFILFPEVQTIKVAAIYLDHRKDLFFNDYARSDLDLFWPRFQNRLRRVTESTEYFPNPNAYNCKWCQHKDAHEKLGQEEPACQFGHALAG